MSTIKVDGIRSNSATSDAITLASDGTCTANITNKPNRNLIINGAMQVAQRGTSSTVDGYGTIDRFRSNLAGCDENPTQLQSDVASGTTPYTLGFRKAFKFTNGNQTSGAGTTDCVAILHRIEAQDIANSGWNYTDSNSKITLSFWCKSSVAQNFYGFFRTQDGTTQHNAFETGSLTADTWTKVTKTITGDSNLQFDNNNNTGLDIEFTMFRGTDRTGTLTLNQWAAYDTNVRVPDMTSTWYTTDNATFEITGVQLEVGSVATDFEHRSYGQELALCQRYYYRWTASSASSYAWMGASYSTSTCFGVIRQLPVTMRATPTTSVSGTFYGFGSDGSTSGHSAFTNTTNNHSTPQDIATGGWTGATGIAEGGRPVIVRAGAVNDYIDASAEL
jgi:hypothetical protein